MMDDFSRDALLSAVRAIHFGAAIALFGAFAFEAFVSTGAGTTPRLRRTAGWSLAIAVASAALWLALESASMSGLAFAQALGGETLSTVLTQTLFGRVWIFRMVVAAILAAAIAAMRDGRSDEGRHAGLRGVAGACALLFLVSLAAAGHAASGQALDRAAHLGIDGLHLLAAGAWLGALWPLVVLLQRCMRDAGRDAGACAGEATRRFSTLGVASVGALLLSGLVNASYTVASFGALAASQYGRLLAAKVALFAAIVALAAINRSRLTRGLASARTEERSVALRRLRRNAILEVVLGLGILAIVGKLGITMPAMQGP